MGRINNPQPLGCSTEGEGLDAPGCTTATAETYYVTNVADEAEWCPGD